MNKKKLFIIFLILILIIIIIVSYFIESTKKPSEMNDNDKSIELGFSTDSICGNLTASDIYGTWYFEDMHGDLPNGELNFGNDGTFEITGWKTKDFISKGKWNYDEIDNTLELKFTDEEEYWAFMITEDLPELIDDIVEVDKDNLLYKVVINYTKNQDSQECFLYLIFFGWSFRHRVEI